MNVATPTSTSESNESYVLELFLKLSGTRSSEWKPQYPLLDHATMSRVAITIAKIVSKEKGDLGKQVILLLRRWCTGVNNSRTLSHSAWLGRSLSAEECVETVLSACIPIIKNEGDWEKRDLEQQLALCYAMLGAATKSPMPLHQEAGEICVLILERILAQRELGLLHHRLLAQMWMSVGQLPVKIDTLVRMTERSFLGIEKTIVWLGTKAVSCLQGIDESFKTVVGCTLLRICSRSPKVFQDVCILLTQMMVVTGAHQGMQILVRSFIQGVEEECQKIGADIVSLYEEDCQVLSALLCVDPSLLPDSGEHHLSRSFVLHMLHELPRTKAACLLSHRPQWLLFTF